MNIKKLIQAIFILMVTSCANASYEEAAAFLHRMIGDKESVDDKDYNLFSYGKNFPIFFKNLLGFGDFILVEHSKYNHNKDAKAAERDRDSISAHISLYSFIFGIMCGDKYDIEFFDRLFKNMPIPDHIDKNDLDYVEAYYEHVDIIRDYAKMGWVLYDEIQRKKNPALLGYSTSDQPLWNLIQLLSPAEIQGFDKPDVDFIANNPVYRDLAEDMYGWLESSTNHGSEHFNTAKFLAINVKSIMHQSNADEVGKWVASSIGRDNILPRKKTKKISKKNLKTKKPKKPKLLASDEAVIDEALGNTLASLDSILLGIRTEQECKVNDDPLVKSNIPMPEPGLPPPSPGGSKPVTVKSGDLLSGIVSGVKLKDSKKRKLKQKIETEGDKLIKLMDVRRSKLEQSSDEEEEDDPFLNLEDDDNPNIVKKVYKKPGNSESPPVPSSGNRTQIKLQCIKSTGNLAKDILSSKRSLKKIANNLAGKNATNKQIAAVEDSLIDIAIVLRRVVENRQITLSDDEEEELEDDWDVDEDEWDDDYDSDY